MKKLNRLLSFILALTILLSTTSSWASSTKTNTGTWALVKSELEKYEIKNPLGKWTSEGSLHVCNSNIKSNYYITSDLAPADNIKFKDIKSTDWYSSTVKNLTNKDIIGGYPDGTFKPNGSVTTAEFLKLSMEVAGIKSDYTVKPWYRDLMQNALDIEIINKALYDSPNSPIKRKDVSLILSKLIEKTPELKGEFITERSKEYDRFKYLLYDTTKLSQEYRDSIYKLFEYGLIVGTTNNKDQVFYNPDSNLTRAEVATIVERLIEPSKRLNKYEKFPKRSDYFDQFDEDGFEELNKYYSNNWGFPDVKNKRFSYYSYELGKETEDYILSEKQIPNLNKILWDLTRTIIKEDDYDYVSNEVWGLQTAEGIDYDPRAYVQKGTDPKSIYMGANSWGYMFWEKTPAVGYDEIGYDNFLWIRVGRLANGYYKYNPKGLTELNGLIDYEYANMFRASLIAIFDEKDGHEIYEYIFSEYVIERSNTNIKYGPNNGKYKYKTIGQYKIVYAYGENSSLNFYFSFK